MTTDLAALRAAFLDTVDPDATVAPQWRAALQQVPRDAFVPYFFRPLPDRPGWRIVQRTDPEWAPSVLGNRPLVTQLNGDDRAAAELREGREVRGWATSSSSQPSLMVLMLEALGLRRGDRVLEIGTGTGYNAALLCHHLGSEAVTSIDIDPVIVAEARRVLAGLGYRPRLLVGDGLRGDAEHAPFDTLVATVAVRRVPATWIEQVRRGGRILFPLDTRNGGGIMPLLTVRDGRAEGRFLPVFGGFMPTRQTARGDLADTAFRTVADDDGQWRDTGLAVEVAVDDTAPFAFFAALRTGGYDVLGFVPRHGGPEQTWLASADGSWACHVTERGAHRVRQGGPARLWDRLEHLHETWTGLGRPARERFGTTATGTGLRFWLDEPGNPVPA